VALYRSDAFVLRTYKLGEADQIVVLFTEDYGKIRAVARRSRSARRQTASYYQPLLHLHAILFGRPSQALHRLNGVDIVASFRTLHEDFEAMRCGLYMTELIEVTTHEREPAPELFALLRTGLEQLTQSTDSRLLLRLFELRLLISIGYLPELFVCVRCARELPLAETAFSAALGGMLCHACAAIVRQTCALSAETLALLRLATTQDTPALPTMCNTRVHQELERVLHTHLTSRLGRELKSYAFLHL
jgi:DNA repair protein RecO (recombination protein O)